MLSNNEIKYVFDRLILEAQNEKGFSAEWKKNFIKDCEKSKSYWLEIVKLNRTTRLIGIASILISLVAITISIVRLLLQ